MLLLANIIIFIKIKLFSFTLIFNGIFNPKSFFNNHFLIILVFSIKSQTFNLRTALVIKFSIAIKIELVIILIKSNIRSIILPLICIWVYRLILIYYIHCVEPLLLFSWEMSVFINFFSVNIWVMILLSVQLLRVIFLRIFFWQLSSLFWQSFTIKS